MQAARAVRIREPGGVEVLELGTIEVAGPGPGEVLVEVAAAGLNRADLLQRRGLYPAPPGVPADVPGLEYAGRIAALGEGVTGWEPGRRVMGIVGGGAMASRIVVRAEHLLHVPEELTAEKAAALPEVFLTAYDALTRQAGLASGEVVLVHAVGSGVGTAAIQLAREIGAVVAGTSRRESKLARCMPLGLQHGIRVEEPPAFADTLRGLTEDRRADVILDLVGGPYLAENARALAPGGRMVVIGLLGGSSGELPLGELLVKRARLSGSVLRGRSDAEKAALVADFTRDVAPLLASGRCGPVLDAVLPMEDIATAHERMEANETFGKIVLTW